MFDIGASELLVIVIVAVLVIGPKDMPIALRTAGRWIGKVRRMSNHFKAGIDNMIREAELEDAEKEWRQRNAKIMADHPDAADQVRDPENLMTGAEMQPLAPPANSHQEPVRPDGASTELKKRKSRGDGSGAEFDAQGEPELPLTPDSLETERKS